LWNLAHSHSNLLNVNPLHCLWLVLNFLSSLFHFSFICNLLFQKKYYHVIYIVFLCLFHFLSLLLLYSLQYFTFFYIFCISLPFFSSFFFFATWLFKITKNSTLSWTLNALFYYMQFILKIEKNIMKVQKINLLTFLFDYFYK